MPGNKLNDEDEDIHRQVHPSFVQAGRPSSQAFRPTPKDEGLLSVDRGSLVTAEEAYISYQQRGHASVGVWTLRVADCSKNDLDVLEDPLPEDAAHAVVDFRQLSPTQAKVVSQLLKAASRGEFASRIE